MSLQRSLEQSTHPGQRSPSACFLILLSRLDSRISVVPDPSARKVVELSVSDDAQQGAEGVPGLVRAASTFAAAAV